MLDRSKAESGGQSEEETVAAVEDGVVVNAPGQKDQLRRQYGLLGLAGIALTVDNAWIALGSSISVSNLSIRTTCLLAVAMDDIKATSDIGASVQSMAALLALSMALAVASVCYSFIGLGLIAGAGEEPQTSIIWKGELSESSIRETWCHGLLC